MDYYFFFNISGIQASFLAARLIWDQSHRPIAEIPINGAKLCMDRPTGGFELTP